MSDADRAWYRFFKSRRLHLRWTRRFVNPPHSLDRAAALTAARAKIIEKYPRVYLKALWWEVRRLIRDERMTAPDALAQAESTLAVD